MTAMALAKTGSRLKIIAACVADMRDCPHVQSKNGATVATSARKMICHTTRQSRTSGTDSRAMTSGKGCPTSKTEQALKASHTIASTTLADAICKTVNWRTSMLRE